LQRHLLVCSTAHQSAALVLSDVLAHMWLMALPDAH